MRPRIIDPNQLHLEMAWPHWKEQNHLLHEGACAWRLVVGILMIYTKIKVRPVHYTLSSTVDLKSGAPATHLAKGLGRVSS